MPPQFEWARYFCLAYFLSLSLLLSFRVPKLSYPSICQPSIFPSVLLSSIALCCTYPDFLLQSFSTSLSLFLSPFHLLFLDWTWHRISFWKLGKAHPWESHALFVLWKENFKERQWKQSKKKQSKWERTVQNAKSSENQVQGQSPLSSAHWASKPFRLPNSWIID